MWDTLEPRSWRGDVYGASEGTGTSTGVEMGRNPTWVGQEVGEERERELMYRTRDGELGQGLFGAAVERGAGVFRHGLSSSNHGAEGELKETSEEGVRRVLAWLIGRRLERSSSNSNSRERLGSEKCLGKGKAGGAPSQGVVTDLQRDIVDRGKDIHQTEVGKLLREGVEREMERCKRLLERLRREMEGSYFFCCYSLAATFIHLSFYNLPNLT
jgi:hypothetical protein